MDSLYQQKFERQYDYDWLRVIAFYLLVLYHTGMIFVEWGFHIENTETSKPLMSVMLFFHEWRLPLLFFISGIAVQYSLRKRNWKQFLQNRTLRLFLPLLFGVLFILPPQIYYERLFEGINYNSFFEFYPTIFQGVYPQGNFSWHHLWYIVYIFLYSIMLLPVFFLLKRAKFKHKIELVFSRKFYIFLFPLPLVVVQAVLRKYYLYDAYNLYNDWAQFTYSMLIFFYGFLFARAGNARKAAYEFRYIALVCAIILTILLYLDIKIDYYYFQLYKPFLMWFVVMTVFGFGVKYLNRGGEVLAYLNQSVYPFYILHQTVIIIIGYYVIQTSWDLWLKFIIIALTTYIFVFLFYEFVIRRVNLVRPLFGLKMKK